MKNILNVVPWKVSKQEACNKSVLKPVVYFVWILKYCNKDHFCCSQWIQILIVWNTMEGSDTLHWFHSLCSPYTHVTSTSGFSQTIPQSMEAGTIQIHFIYRDVWNLKGCSIRICGFWKKLLLSWGLLNKDLIALNACVQCKWIHAKLCNSITGTLNIWQRTIVGYNSWLSLIWDFNQT